MAFVQVQCPDCHRTDVVQYGKQANGTQRYRCNNRDGSRTIFLLQYQDKGRLPAVQQQMVDMTLHGSGVRDIVRVLRGSSATVIDVRKKKLGWQTQLEEVGLKVRQIGGRIPANPPPLRALVAAGLKIMSSLLPGTDRVRYEFLAGEGAEAGGRTGDEPDCPAQPHGGGSHLTPGGAPLMPAIGAKQLLQIIIGTGKSRDAIAVKQAWPVASADLQNVPDRWCEAPSLGLMLPPSPEQPVQPALHGGLRALGVIVQD